MPRLAMFSLLLSLTVLSGCASTVVVPVPPRMDLAGYGNVGIVEFASNANRTIDAQVTRRFQEHIHSAQPGTRFVELGARDALLAAVGSKQLDADALRRIGQNYGVAAVFVGDLVYSEPKTGVLVGDLARLKGGVRTEVRGDISGRLLETKTGASVWSHSAWARREVGGVSVSAEGSVSGGVRAAHPREEMVPTLVFHLTQDFRPTSVRRRVD